MVSRTSPRTCCPDSQSTVTYSDLSKYSEMALEADDESKIMMASIGLDESVSLQDLVDATIADQEIQ